ncbi:MAG: hypothetical protein CVT67_10815 [Actinobacteria bacterium HGW-Actinobacteria-7]|nr:MAG: hypothetical protein CVT67_10815 [Actinobacteria bacterium HGW-Actinobacteria-7]
MKGTAFWLAAAAVACVPLGLLGCSQAAPPTASLAAQGAPAAPAIEALTPDAKRSQIASSFPLEVPVPAGEFTRAKAQGDVAWDYVVRIESTPDAVLKWYRDVYASRQWTLVGERDYGNGDSGGRGRVLTFRKGNAECEVAVDAASDSEGLATARVVLGVGAPVLETQ